jgi:hypothetical protein
MIPMQSHRRMSTRSAGLSQKNTILIDTAAEELGRSGHLADGWRAIRGESTDAHRDEEKENRGSHGQSIKKPPVVVKKQPGVSN